MPMDQSTEKEKRQEFRQARRRTLEWLGISFLGGALAACTNSGKPEVLIPVCTQPPEWQKATLLIPDLYHGPVRQLKDKPLITPDKMDLLLKTMVDSKIYLMQKHAGELYDLINTTTNPSGLPNIIHTNSYPLAITYDNSHVSLAPISTNWENRESFVVDANNIKNKGRLLKPISWGIHLGTKDAFGNAGPLPEALFLEKEYITQLLNFRVQEEFFDYLTVNNLATITDLNGNQIMDMELKQEIGAAILINEMTDKKSNTWCLMDMFPMLITGYFAGALVEDKSLPTTLNGGRHLYTAMDYLSQNIELRQLVEEVIVEWQESKQLLPPEGITNIIGSPIVLRAVTDLCQELY